MKNGIDHNREHKRSCCKLNGPPLTVPKTNFYSKKMLLCKSDDWKRVLIYELPPENQMIDSNKYCS